MRTKYFIYTENRRKTPVCKQSFMDIFKVGKDKVSSLAKNFINMANFLLKLVVETTVHIFTALEKLLSKISLSPSSALRAIIVMAEVKESTSHVHYQ